MEREDIVPGAIVRLASGGPPMTVLAAPTRSGYVRLIYFTEGNEICEISLPAASLAPAPPGDTHKAKQERAMRFLTDPAFAELSDREVGRMARVSHKTIAKMRRKHREEQGAQRVAKRKGK